MTGGGAWPAPAGTGAPTRDHTGHTAPLSPSPQPPRPAGPERLWWALAATAVLAASVAGGLFLSGRLPLNENPHTRTTSQVVRSAAGWQAVDGVSVQRGDRITVQFVSGEWTANSRKLPMTGPTGYDAETDRSQGAVKACKVKGTAPFAALLTRLVGEQNFPAHAVGRRLTIRATGSGTLQLGMNDAAGVCSQDNRGTLTVRVSVTQP